MAAYELSTVLGAVLTSLSRAQFVSDEYTARLNAEYRGENELDQLGVPNAQFGPVKLTLRFAIAEVSTSGPPRTSGDGDPTGIKVIVDAAELAELPSDVVDVIELSLAVHDVAALPVEGTR